MYKDDLTEVSGSWPSFHDFQDSMPLLWPDLELASLSKDCVPFYDTAPNVLPSKLLPPSVSGRWAHNHMLDSQETDQNSLLFQQKQKLWKDWAIVSRAFPEKDLIDYVYHWLIVNTRSFYYDSASVSAPKSRDDCMILCPFIDYFNHADHGVSAELLGVLDHGLTNSALWLIIRMALLSRVTGHIVRCRQHVKAKYA